jgi:hypothetical protein
MSTSGSTDFNLTTNTLVEKAFHILGVGSEGEALTPRQYEDGRVSLNLMVKSWGTKEHLWLQTTSSVTLVASQAGYALTPKPMRVLEARRKITASAIETPLSEWARRTYYDQPNKTIASIPVAFYYEPQLTTGTLYLWPTPSASTATDMTVELSYLRRIDDFDATNNDPDLPQEWLETIVWNLANRLEPEYPVNDNRLAQKIEMRAEMLLAAIEAFDTEPASLYLQPETRW